MPPQPPFSPDQIIQLITHAAVAISTYVIANPLIAVFILAAIAVLAYLPPIVSLILIIIAISYLIQH